jgi:hypothetical protein
MNSRSAQVLAATLAFLLIVLIGATIFVLLSRPAPPPPPSVLPSLTVGPSSSGFSPSPSSPPPTLLPSASLTSEPTSSTPATPSPTPSPTPTPTPTISPTSPQRVLRLVGIGLDRRSDPTGVQRSVSFVVDGPSLISADLSGVSAGSVRLCLSRQALDRERECRTTRNGGLERSVFDAGQSQWLVTMIGTSDLASPFATLSLRFNALSANVHLDSFRFNGTNDPHYNGFTVELAAAADGNLRLQAGFDDGNDNPYQYHLSITPLAGGPPLVDQAGGPSGSLDMSFGLTGGQSYSVALGEPEQLAGGGQFAVFVDATLTWP